MNRPRWLLVLAVFLSIAGASAARWQQHRIDAATPAAAAIDHTATEAPSIPSGEVATASPAPSVPRAPSPSNPTEPPSPPTAGMVVAIDPETGQLTTPSAEQLRELFPVGTSAQTTEGFVVTHRPDGSVSIDVGSQLQEYSVVRIGPDGKVIRACATTPPDPRTLETLPTPTHEER